MSSLPSQDSSLQVALAVLTNEMKHLARLIEDQQERIDSQGAQLSELIALKNQGKGSLWILITIGGVIGATISNLKTIIEILKH